MIASSDQPTYSWHSLPTIIHSILDILWVSKHYIITWIVPETLYRLESAKRHVKSDTVHWNYITTLF